ncbi:MAG: response regulator [Saprospiraceae bacterium]
MKTLVVDDEQDIKLLFEQKFRNEIKNGAIDLVFANSAEDALKLMDLYRQEVAMILTDINMPGMSGLELLKEIKQDYNKPTPQIMMISAYGDEANRKEAKNLGADDFLTKPLDFKSLKKKLILTSN